MAKKLIALVTVLAVVNGIRQEFPPGSELPELPEHDVQELKRMNAIEDVSETMADNKATAKSLELAQADFERERQAIVASNASIEEAPAASPAADKTAASPPGKKR